MVTGDTEQRERGHPRFYKLLDTLRDLHSLKSYDYAGIGDPLGNFKRVSELKKMYPGFDWESPFGTGIDYMLKQFDAMMWMRSQKTQARVEALPQRLEDIAVYSLLAIVLLEEEETKDER